MVWPLWWRWGSHPAERKAVAGAKREHAVSVPAVSCAGCPAAPDCVAVLLSDKICRPIVVPHSRTACIEPSVHTQVAEEELGVELPPPAPSGLTNEAS